MGIGGYERMSRRRVGEGEDDRGLGMGRGIFVMGSSPS